MRKNLLFTIMLLSALINYSQPTIKYHQDGRSLIFTNAKGERLRVTPYGDYIVRVQSVRTGEDFFADDHYEMVESHQWPGSLMLSEDKTSFKIITKAADGIAINLNKNHMLLTFSQNGKDVPFLEESPGTWWEGDTIHTSFVCDLDEHFTGLGHGYFGRPEGTLDLRGETINRNYGTEQANQAPLIVPFYLSSKGYGVFLNSTFLNSFSFGKDGRYEFSIQGNGRMDFFVILGPQFSKIIDRYTQLTGRPRFPPKAIFGLGLSDKANDEFSSDPSDENWWKKKITDHRNAGFPIDHIINDNRWRAGGGKRCESYFDWDSSRYPDPREYEKWVKLNGLILTIDFNRCIAAHSDGWKASYNIPQPDGVDFNESAPDFTRKEVREWFWNLHWRKSLNPALAYPGDALWIDEFDELGAAPLSMTLGNGRTWQEMKNYWFFLIAKALVQEGWDKNFNGTKRPFVWVRGMTAGAQRYATLWSGDIKPTYTDMKAQVRGMQLAGLSGFPFWGHDAGGFYDWVNKKGPDDTMYRQWSMAFGSFSPFWKPHGVGESRWPLDRSIKAQKDAKIYCDLRYELIPYTYTLAHISNETGMPIARAMLIDHQNDSLAWKNDLQYMWGDEILVVPNCSDGDNVNVWLPKGEWYDFWNDEKIKGGQTISYNSPIGKLPLFIKAGAIIPMANFALGTTLIPKDSLNINVYTGSSGKFILYEDDGITEAYKYKNEKRTTAITFNQSIFTLNVAAAVGNYNDAPDQRAYRVDFHGLSKPVCLEVNGVQMKTIENKIDQPVIKDGVVWDANKKILSVFIKKFSVAKTITIKRVADCK
jgi:alpha-glucosidase (family GH31 glycosyl hydrolase)